MAAEPIIDYTSLQLAITRWLNRSDLTDQIPQFIQLAEAEIHRKLRRTVRRKTYTITAATGCIPVEMKELLSARLVTGSPQLDGPIICTNPEGLAIVRARRGDAAGRPTHCAIVGKEVLFVARPDQNYSAELTGVAALQKLSAQNTINDELREAPDMYLWGALLQAEPYLEHDERIPTWRTRFTDAINELNELRDREEWSLSFRPMTLTRVF